MSTTGLPVARDLAISVAPSAWMLLSARRTDGIRESCGRCRVHGLGMTTRSTDPSPARSSVCKPQPPSTMACANASAPWGPISLPADGRREHPEVRRPGNQGGVWGAREGVPSGQWTEWAEGGTGHDQRPKGSIGPSAAVPGALNSQRAQGSSQGLQQVGSEGAVAFSGEEPLAFAPSTVISLLERSRCVSLETAPSFRTSRISAKALIPLSSTQLFSRPRVVSMLQWPF